MAGVLSTATVCGKLPGHDILRPRSSPREEPMRSLPLCELLFIASSVLLLLSIGNFIYHYVLFTEQTWHLMFF
jgi:hypothetical protein